jgi:hypothetical protein
VAHSGQGIRTLLDGLQKVWVHNVGLKLLALVLGALSFFGIRSETGFEVRYDIPIRVDLAGGIAILNQHPTTALVTFRGSQEDLRRLDLSRISAVVHAKATDPSGSESVPIRPRDVKGAPGVRATEVMPPSVEVTFDVEDERPFPVERPATVGTPLIGHAQVTFEPPAVLIRGPRRQLNRMLSEAVNVKTEPVDVDGRVKSFTKRVPVLSPGATWVSHIEPAEIIVNVDIVTESVTREWTNVTVLAVTEPGFSGTVRFDPPVVQVSVTAGAETMQTLATNAVKVFVDCAWLAGAGSYDLPVYAHLAGVRPQETRIRPASVKTTIEER